MGFERHWSTAQSGRSARSAARRISWCGL